MVAPVLVAPLCIIHLDLLCRASLLCTLDFACPPSRYLLHLMSHKSCRMNLICRRIRPYHGVFAMRPWPTNIGFTGCNDTVLPKGGKRIQNLDVPWISYLLLQLTRLHLVFVYSQFNTFYKLNLYQTHVIWISIFVY